MGHFGIRTLFFLTANCYSTVWIYHILLIHSAGDGHLGCFHLLTIVISTHEHLCTCFQLFWVYIQEWDCWVIGQFYVQIFEELPNCFLKQLYNFTVLPAMGERSNFSTSLATHFIVHLKNSGQSSGCEVVSHCGFDLHFPNDY